MMPKLYKSPVRHGIREVLQQVENNLLIASPFIKVAEAQWVCDQLASKSVKNDIHLQVLTDVRSENVLSGSLDIQALGIFMEAFSNVAIINLPRLHAKVYVADEKFAVVTSANLTPSGMESNFEYGIGLSDPAIVIEVRGDLQSYASLGNTISKITLTELIKVADDISADYRKLQRQAGKQLKQHFAEKLRAANHEFLKAQVGSRSAHSLFSEAILYLLSLGPLATEELQPRIQSLLPDLCDDSVDLVINGQRFGKRWKHAVRNAQQSLKRSGRIVFNGTSWILKS